MKALFIALALLVQVNLFACECGSNPPFSKVMNGGKLVALVKVTRYLSYNDVYGSATPMSMEVEAVSLFRGVETRRTIKVWGDPGNLCRPYLSVFRPGGYYVMALDEGDARSGNNGETAADYAVGNCGEHWLAADLSLSKAFGRFDDTPGGREITFGKLRAAFRKSDP